jgi:hypothetical protein
MDNQQKWAEIKRQVDERDFPDASDLDAWRKAGDGTFHGKGEKSHPLDCYSKTLSNEVGWQIEAVYRFCPKCRKTTSQFVAAFNNQENVAYVRWFKRERLDILEVAEEIFNS